jgi:hypothetical protein
MSFGNATFGGFIVGQASRLPSNDLRSQARRPRYIQKVQKQAAFGITPFLQPLNLQNLKITFFIFPSFQVVVMNAFFPLQKEPV